MIWHKVRLGSLIKHRDNRYKPNSPEIQSLKRIDKIDFAGNIFISEKPSNTDMILICNGDFVISGINVEKGAMAIYEGLESILATIHYSSYILDKTKIDTEFLKLFLQSQWFKNALKEQVPGGIKTEIKPKHLLPLEVLIPSSVEEQQKIVMSFMYEKNIIDATNEALDEQLKLVKQLRETFLMEAMQGKLVPQDPSDEAASKILLRIISQNSKLIKDAKSKKNDKILLSSENKASDQIPVGWIYLKLGEVIIDGPLNGFSPKESKDGKGIKVVTLSATTCGYFKYDCYKLASTEVSDDSHLWLKKNDVLIQRGNSLEYVGISAVFSGNDNEYIYPDLMIKIRFYEELNIKFIHYLLNSPMLRQYFKSNASGSQKSMPKINQTVLINAPLVIPPLNEQARIVHKLDELVKFCDQLEKNIMNKKLQNANFLQQIIHESLTPEFV